MSAKRERLYDGIYWCPSCDARYDVADAAEDDLTCNECGADLQLEDDSDEGDD